MNFRRKPLPSISELCPSERGGEDEAWPGAGVMAVSGVHSGAALITLTPVTRAGLGCPRGVLLPASRSLRPPTPLGDTAIQTPES